MNYRSNIMSPLCRWASAAVALSFPTAGFAADAVDAEAAIRLAKRTSCLRCHGVDKKKEGPSYSFLAARYAGKPDAEDKLVKHITSGERVKLTDGHNENHKALQNIDPEELRNLVRWILSQ